MIVVADSSPLNYLVLIDEVGLLPALFSSVLIPSAVSRELQDKKAPDKVRTWLLDNPPWLQIHQVPLIENPSPIEMDVGEREAIQLAITLQIHTVLIDDAAGRLAAESFHLETRGTLAILEIGHRQGLTNFRAAVEKLMRTNFRISVGVLQGFLGRNP